jgi:hypothetical protein
LTERCGPVRNPDPLTFWTNLGMRICGHDAPALPSGHPWDAAWGDPPGLPPEEGCIISGEGSRPRKIWHATRSVLHPLGFSRALRLEPWPGIELFIPFHRGAVAVLPQGFSGRIPRPERAFALAGKSAAARKCGVRLLVSIAAPDPVVLGILAEGRVSCTTADRLGELLCSSS